MEPWTALKRAFRGTKLTASQRIPFGTNVFSLDWDLLIILDSCRVDALRTVTASGDYDFLDNAELTTMVSVGGSTLEWVASTFVTQYASIIQETALVSANGWPHRILVEGYRPEDRVHFGPAWISWDTIANDSLGTHIPAWQYGKGRAGYSGQPQADAKTVVDLSIDLGRRHTFDRTIVHVIEPHYPYAAAARQRGSLELSQIEQHPFDHIRETEHRTAVWEAYLTELRAGLDAVGTLLRNFDAETVLISADHGEAFGEWGIYGHGSGSFHPSVRRVPLLKTEASDDRSHSPGSIPVRDTDVEDHLRSLGYLSDQPRGV